MDLGKDFEGLKNSINKANEKTGGRIHLVDINNIFPNKKNFYSMKDIDELVETIEESGLIHPLIVYEEDDRYILTSGHRRLEALKKLWNKYEGEENEYDEVPVMITSYADEYEEELALINANNFRQLMKEEKIEEVRRRKRLYGELKKLGRWRGNINKRIADEFGISEKTVKNYTSEKIAKEKTSLEIAESEIAKIKKIINNLLGLETLELNETLYEALDNVAYLIENEEVLFVDEELLKEGRNNDES